jgi:hypothetical protein
MIGGERLGGRKGSVVKRLFGNLLVAAVLIAILAFFAAPAVGFFAIRSAAEASDVQGLTRLVDFAAVRQSLRPQLLGRPQASAPAPSFLEDPIGAVRRQLEQNPIVGAPDVDSYLTPAALAALTRGEGRYASQWSTTASRPTDVDKPWPKPVFWGVNRARLAVEDQGGSRTVFTFERRGPFEWKLVHIGLPDGAAPAVAAAAAAK